MCEVKNSSLGGPLSWYKVMCPWLDGRYPQWSSVTVTFHFIAVKVLSLSTPSSAVVLTSTSQESESLAAWCYPLTWAENMLKMSLPGLGRILGDVSVEWECLLSLRWLLTSTLLPADVGRYGREGQRSFVFRLWTFRGEAIDFLQLLFFWPKHINIIWAHPHPGAQPLWG